MFITGLFVTIIGVAISYWGYGWFKLALDSKDWPNTSGEIMSSQLVEDNPVDRTYAVRLTYQYTVKQTQYTGKNIEHISSASLLKQAKELLNQYPVGTQVRVFYNPNSPDVCVLKNGLNFTDSFIFLLGAIFTGLGLVLLLSSLFTH